MTFPDDTMDHVPKPKFDSTHWSLVLEAQGSDSPEAQLAFAQLCEKYWYPLYAFVRQSEPDANTACDLIQGFFAKVIEKKYIADADPLRGKFRTFLLASLTNYLSNERAKSKTLKRGGDLHQISIQWESGEQRFLQEPVNGLSPDKQFQRRWAITLLKQVLDALRSDFTGDGKAEQFEQLVPFLTARGGTSYAEVAQELKMTEGAVKVAVHRVRKLYQQRLRSEIAKTVGSQAGVEDEIAELFQAFSN